MTREHNSVRDAVNTTRPSQSPISSDLGVLWCSSGPAVVKCPPVCASQVQDQPRLTHTSHGYHTAVERLARCCSLITCSNHKRVNGCDPLHAANRQPIDLQGRICANSVILHTLKIFIQDLRLQLCTQIWRMCEGRMNRMSGTGAFWFDSSVFLTNGKSPYFSFS